jgi:phage terminase small subunit
MQNARYIRFIDEYLLDHNATRAAVAAGYSKRTAAAAASRLLRHVNVAPVLKARQRELQDQLQISKDTVITELVAAIELAKAQSNPQAMIAGWREIAKLLGYYEPEKHKVDVSVSSKRLLTQFEAMSDEELLKLAGTEQPESAAVVV